MRVLILGGAGLMGAGSVRDLLSPLSTGISQVIAADTSPQRLETLGHDPRLKTLVLDVSDQEALAAALRQLTDEGILHSHLILLLETAQRSRHHPLSSDVVELVWTGPEPLGITNRDTGVVMRELFGGAETEVLVAGYAVYQGRRVFQRLAERMEERPGLAVKMYLDVQRPLSDTTHEADLLRRFTLRFRTQEWPGRGRLPALYYDPRSLAADATPRTCLHAKCIVVDRRLALIGSANLTEAAQTRNIEAGVLVRCERFAGRLADHFESLANAGLLRLME